MIGKDESACRNCEGAEWVCEDHQDHPWGGMSASDMACHCGGAGAPCPVCNQAMAFAGMRAATILECAAKAFEPFDWGWNQAPGTYRALANRIGEKIKLLQFASVGRNANRQDAEERLGPKDEHAVPPEEAGDAQRPSE